MSITAPLAAQFKIVNRNDSTNITESHQLIHVFFSCAPVTMKYSLICLLFIVPCCFADNFVCQLYDSDEKSLEKFCGLFQGILPLNCSKNHSIDASEVQKLGFNGCDNDIILSTIKTYPNIRVLDISYSQYHSLDWLDVKIEHLAIFNASHNQLANISKLLQNVSSLTEIDLSYNKLETIDRNTFGGLNNLKAIYLSHNQLEHIDADGFADSPNLEIIDLSNNNFLNIPEFLHNNKLKIIHLEENTIKNFTCQRIQWSNEVSLFLTWSYVERFDGNEHCKGREMSVIWDGDNEGIIRTSNDTYELHCNDHSFRNVRYFRAGHGAFYNIVEVVTSFDQHLVHLDLSENFIGKWDMTVLKRFNNLNKLSLSSTKLADFDVSMIENARELKSLDLSNNNLSQIKNVGTLRNFFQLKELNIAGNQLQNTLELKHFLNPAIEILDLSDNNVRPLYDGTFERFMQLKTLHLRNTNLEMSTGNPFEKLVSLRALDISCNNLTGIDFKRFSTTLIKLQSFSAASCQIQNVINVIQYFGVSLQRLNLSGNSIDRIDRHTFDTLINLTHLNLSHSNLPIFSLDLLRNQTWLNTLDLSHNKLQSINLAALPNFKHLRRLYLECNDLTKLDNFVSSSSPNVSIGIAENQFSCIYLKHLKHYSSNLKYIDDPLNQKHGEDCRSSAQAIGDFLDAVYDKVKFW